MNSNPSTSTAKVSIRSDTLDHFFASEHQRTYVQMLMSRGGLTRRRAECFVRLWAYLLAKQQVENGNLQATPFTELSPTNGAVTCTHREAAELFYCGQERGSDRAAGLMIDRLVALGLLEKHFDGQTLCLTVRSIPELAAPTPSIETVHLQADQFNPRTDTIPIANLLTRNYAELIKDTATTSHKIARSLRTWSQQYPTCMRVLRRLDNGNPVAISVLYPVTAASEFNFFQSPGKSFYLTSDMEVDPFQVALPGDLDCTSVYIRAWMIDTPYLKGLHLYQLLQDTKQTLSQMQADFPNLCDLYSVIIHPLYEELRLALGFQKTFQDPQRSYHWIYLALDHFLKLDIQQALSTLKTKAD